MAPPLVEPSVAVTIGVYVCSGRVDEPSKCFQKPLASMASWKRTEKIAQLMPLASSLGIDDGRVSESEVVVTLAVDMVRASMR
jgi:hypothetical protein